MHTHKTLEAVGHDNRGIPSDNPRDDVMFGFVYFNDEKRVTYATGHGVTGSTGGWEPITPTHVRLAKEYLDSMFPGWDEMPEKAEEKA